MKLYKKPLLFIIVFFLSIILIYVFFHHSPPIIISVKYNPQLDNISFHWKNSKGEQLINIGSLENDLTKQNKKLLFAMNGGMFDEKLAPIGLYIENKETIKPLNTFKISETTNNSIPNFYKQPNGIFYITMDNIAGICETEDFNKFHQIKYGTQSGPMLVIDGEINNLFSVKSKNYNIRNGVGILPNNEILFAISRNKVTFYEFAKYFKDHGCNHALYLDGYVSKAFIPEHGLSEKNGELGVIIAISK